MKDRRTRPLARMGLGDDGRRELEDHLYQRKHPVRLPAPRRSPGARDEDDEDLPPPRPSRTAAPVVNVKKPPPRQEDDDEDSDLPKWVRVGSDEEDVPMQDLVGECQQQSQYLNGWESKFIDSIATQLDEKSGLTGRQYQKLKDVHARIATRTWSIPMHPMCRCVTVEAA